MQLTTSLIRLGATPRDKNEAIRQVAALLAENGKVAPEYVEGMFAREAQENTYLGNGVAIPHGTPQSRHLIKETAIAVLQVPGGIDWEDDEGEPAYLIVGIAASDNEHLAVLKRLSTVVGDEEVAEKLAKTTNAEDIRSALSDAAGRRHGQIRHRHHFLPDRRRPHLHGAGSAGEGRAGARSRSQNRNAGQRWRG